MARLAHVSVTARDATKLARFYQQAFGFSERRPPRRLSGPEVSRGNGLPNVSVLSHWLYLSEMTDCFLEIMQYGVIDERPEPSVNSAGLAHIALKVANINRTVETVLRCGGRRQGEITNLGTDCEPILVIYMRDPEGNIPELEQEPDA